jgi:hypothetical protein
MPSSRPMRRRLALPRISRTTLRRHMPFPRGTTLREENPPPPSPPPPPLVFYPSFPPTPLFGICIVTNERTMRIAHHDMRNQIMRNGARRTRLVLQRARAPFDIATRVEVIRRVYVGHDGVSRDLGAEAHPPPTLRKGYRSGWCVEISDYVHDDLRRNENGFVGWSLGYIMIGIGVRYWYCYGQ